VVEPSATRSSSYWERRCLEGLRGWVNPLPVQAFVLAHLTMPIV
jgi:hypothetical protein